jgi:hypothetical protein
MIIKIALSVLGIAVILRAVEAYLHRRAPATSICAGCGRHYDSRGSGALLPLTYCGTNCEKEAKRP